MTIYLALSCLQGRPAVLALDELLRLEPDGIQLTPGCLPPPDFEAQVTARGIPTALHHNFDWRRYRRRAWDENGTCLALSGASVHAPPRRLGRDALWRAAADRAIETMYPGDALDYSLSTGEEIEEAMEARLRLVVDVSHIRIQFESGVIADSVWRRLQEYERIEEVHVSDNDGKRDTHKPISGATFGLGWAREWGRAHAGAPVVVEGYMHRLNERERANQIALVR